MATSQATKSTKEISKPSDFLDDSWLECSICLEALTRNHRVLPCQHTFCLPCLEDVVSSSATKNKKISDGDSNSGVNEQAKGFLCPECRANVDISLDKLPSNVILNRILEGRESGGAILSKPENTNQECKTSLPRVDQNIQHKSTPITSQTEKRITNECDKYKAFAEAARSINEKETCTVKFSKQHNNMKNHGNCDKMSLPISITCDMMKTDIKPPSIPAPPIPGNLATNPFVQMVENEIIPHGIRSNLEKENVKDSKVLTSTATEKGEAGSFTSKTHENQMNIPNHELLSKNTVGNLNAANTPILPPRSLSIIPPMTSAKFSSPKTNFNTERIQPATSSLSISGTEDGSSPESPAPSLPPKPAFSYSNVSLKTKESPHRQSTEILGIRSTNIPPPAQPPPPLPIHHKLSLKQQIEKELCEERKLTVPPSRTTSGEMPHQVYKALYDYTPNRNDELELQKNNLYIVFEKCQDGWFKGSGLATLKTGVFPGNYVQHVQDDDNVESQLYPSMGPNKSFLREQPAHSTSDQSSKPSCRANDLIDFSKDAHDNHDNNVIDAKSGHKMTSTLYRATMTYPASSQYELDLKQGDVVILIKKREDGWCKGTLQKNGLTGLFPISFVEEIHT